MTQQNGPRDIDESIDEVTTRTAALALAQQGQAKQAEMLNQIKQRWQARQLATIVVGEVSRGKSTLINALIEENLLPSDFKAASSTWVQLRHTKRFSASATISVEDRLSIVDIGKKDLPTYLTVRGEKELAARHGRGTVVESVLIGLPARILADGLELIDTPGVGGLRAAHRQAALAALCNADAVIFVTRPGEPLSASERRFLAEAVDRVEQCVLVHTHRDETDDPDAALEADRQTLTNLAEWEALLGDQDRAARLAAHFADVAAVSVSAMNALDAQITDDAALRSSMTDASNINLLHEIIATQIVDRAHAIHRRNRLRLAEIVLDDVRTRAAERCTLLRDDEVALAELENRAARVSRWVEGNGSFWRAGYDLVCDQVPNEMTKFASARCAELVREYDHTYFSSLKLDEIRREAEELNQVPAAALTEMLALVRNAIAEASERVRKLMGQDNLGATLDQLTRAQAELGEIDFGPTKAGFHGEDLTAFITGGTTGAGAMALATLALQHGAWISLGAIAPVVIPFIIGGALFAGLERRKRTHARTVREALKHVQQICSQIKETAVEEAQRVFTEARRTIATEIKASIAELEDRIAQDRQDIAEQSQMAHDVRKTRIAEFEQVIAECEQISTEIVQLRSAI